MTYPWLETVAGWFALLTIVSVLIACMIEATKRRK